MPPTRCDKSAAVSRATLAIVALSSVVLSGCLTPLNHPLRAEPGLFIGGGVGAGVGAGKTIHCYEPCRDLGKPMIGAGLSATAGLMAMPTENIGLILGLEAGTNSQRGWFTRDGSATAFAHTTWQDSSTAVGTGIEVGDLMWGPKVSAHRRLDDKYSVAVWARYLHPWTPADGVITQGMWTHGRYPAVDVGARLEWRRIAVNYAFGTQIGGATGQLWYIHGTQHDECWHSVSFSFQLVLPWQSRTIQGDVDD